jgi:hypothetical protein
MKPKTCGQTADFACSIHWVRARPFTCFLTATHPTRRTRTDFFMLLLAPARDAQQERVAKDVLLVLDRSGSMDGEKFQQAQTALRYILQQLNPEDRFHLLSFSTGVETYAPACARQRMRRGAGVGRPAECSRQHRY